MKKYSSTFTALVTPFKEDKIDLHSLENLVKNQLTAGIGGFVINGTTAESPTLQWNEVVEIYSNVRSWVGPKFPLLVGTGSNSTAKTIELSKKAEALGADGVLVVVPYYNKPPQRGLIAHFTAVADSIKIPTILYNVPSRTITGLSVPTIAKLAAHPNIIGIKEASGNIQMAKEIRAQCGPDFILLSGDDGTYPEFLQAGGNGIISVATHIVPGLFVKLLSGKESAQSFRKYLPLIGLLFAEANPIPVKKALQLLGVIESASLRLPLCELEEHLTRDILAELETLELL